jgi:putative ABC transport system ATP-binding protein
VSQIEKTFAIEARSLHRHFPLGDGSVHALRGVNLQVAPGEFVAVMGPSGSGKSTLLHLLGLLDAPDEGEVLLAGRSTKGLDDDALTDLRRRKLGFVFQSFELVPNLTAAENILLPAEIEGRKASAQTRLTTLAARLGISDRLSHRPSQLSGGQRQRVALARALINEPVVILADEPTGNLDSKMGGEVLEVLRRGVDEEGWTVVTVTHDLRAARTADRVLFLRDGELVGEGNLAGEDATSLLERYLSG